MNAASGLEAKRAAVLRYARGVKERMQTFATLNGILAGFSLATAVQLVASSERGVASMLTIAMLFPASGFLLGATIGCYFIVVDSGNLESQVESLSEKVLAKWSDSLYDTTNSSGTWVLTFLGIVLLLLGIGSAGWIISPLIGCASASPIVLVMVLYVCSINAKGKGVSGLENFGGPSKPVE